jgi:hypothetical protein
MQPYYEDTVNTLKIFLQAFRNFKLPVEAGKLAL